MSDRHGRSSLEDWVAMPSCVGPFRNGSSEPCDMAIGSCCCGAYHTLQDWPESVREALAAADVLES